MELNLHPIATKCFVSGREFQEGDRVVSYLVREATGEVARRDLLAAEDPPSPGSGEASGPRWMPPAFVYCRWVVAFKNRKANENPALTLRLTAENLFLTLADPASEPSPANTPLLQFLALMLERKKLLKPRGLTEDGARQIFEHMASHQLYEVPVGELDVEFFQKIQEHLHVLVGGPKPAAAVPTSSPAAAGTG
ncbi:MAG TPA: hypothetical protein VG936_01460 [Lacunisphaera sp.]|nr:hypothetical protein [Lacunisphaera sp.]